MTVDICNEKENYLSELVDKDLTTNELMHLCDDYKEFIEIITSIYETTYLQDCHLEKKMHKSYLKEYSYVYSDKQEIIDSIKRGDSVYWWNELYRVYVNNGELYTECIENGYCCGISDSEVDMCFFPFVENLLK